MNLKGLEINKKMYKRINEIGVDKLKTTMLQGIEEFKKFSWSNFVKQEFSDLINCMNILEIAGIFNNISDNQLFIFNYYTDVTEMDIVTVLLDKEDTNIVIDIEFKSGEFAEEKLDSQISKRINEHMNQLFLNGKYIVIGMTDRGFYKACYYDSKALVEISQMSDLVGIFHTLRNNEYVEAILTQANNLAGIHSLYNDMENGKFKYYEETKRTTELILKKIEDGYKAVVCLSNPGTGKTVVAFKLFFENEDTMFLIMNQKFYNSLGLTKYFVEGRCFFGSDAFLHQDLSNKIVIVDEAQRLSKEFILKIINKSKAAIIFGDTGQSFMVNDLELDGHKIINYLRENGIYVYNKELKRSKRYNDSVEKALNFLTSKASTIKEKIKLEDYEINLYYDVADFLTEYHNCKSGKKMFITYNYRDQTNIMVGDEIFTMADKDFYSFSVSTGPENFIGHTLHAISFDVENSFVYLKGVKVIKRKNKDILYKDEGDFCTEENITKFLNELNILFTRGKKSLTIYTDDLEVYLYLNKRLKNFY